MIRRIIMYPDDELRERMFDVLNKMTMEDICIMIENWVFEKRKNDSIEGECTVINDEQKLIKGE